MDNFRKQMIEQEYLYHPDIQRGRRGLEHLNHFLSHPPLSHLTLFSELPSIHQNTLSVEGQASLTFSDSFSQPLTLIQPNEANIFDVFSFEDKNKRTPQIESTGVKTQSLNPNPIPDEVDVHSESKSKTRVDIQSSNQNSIPDEVDVHSQSRSKTRVDIQSSNKNSTPDDVEALTQSGLKILSHQLTRAEIFKNGFPNIAKRVTRMIISDCASQVKRRCFGRDELKYQNLKDLCHRIIKNCSSKAFGSILLDSTSREEKKLLQTYKRLFTRFLRRRYLPLILKQGRMKNILSYMEIKNKEILFFWSSLCAEIDGA